MLSLKNNFYLESIEALFHKRGYDKLHNSSRKCNQFC